MGKKAGGRTTKAGQLERKTKKGTRFTLFKGDGNNYQVEMKAENQPAVYLVGDSENYEKREIDAEVERAYERIIGAEDPLAQFWMEREDLALEVSEEESDDFEDDLDGNPGDSYGPGFGV